MNKRKMLWGAMAVVGALSMCASALAQDPNTTTTTTITQSTMTTPDSNHLSVGDRIFLMDLVHANVREIELSKVAYHQASSPGVSHFAHHMLMDHRALQDKLMATYGDSVFMKDWGHAVKESYTPMHDEGTGGDSDMDKPHYNNWAHLYGEDWAQVRQLRDENGSSFDRMYLEWMATDHAKLLDEIDRHDHRTDNADIKALISTIRPTVEGHLNRARDYRFDYSGNSFPYMD